MSDHPFYSEWCHRPDSMMVCQLCEVSVDEAIEAPRGTRQLTVVQGPLKNLVLVSLCEDCFRRAKTTDIKEPA